MTIQANPCTVTAMVDDKECGADKMKKNKREVQIGYWIKPGETISRMVSIAVPLNAKPDVKATLLLDASSSSSAILGSSVTNTSVLISQGYLRIKNQGAGTYLNMQTGPVTCTPIEEGWWPSQWEIIPVNGTNYYVIKNRSKNAYISAEPATTFSSESPESVTSLWMLEPMEGSNIFMLKNIGTNTYLVVQSGKLQLASAADKAATAKWIIEQ